MHIIKIGWWDRKGLGRQAKSHLNQALKGNEEPAMPRGGGGGVLQAEGGANARDLCGEQSSHV